MEEQDRNEYLQERHKKAVDELKVSDSSGKPQLVMGLSLLVVFIIIVAVLKLLA